MRLTTEQQSFTKVTQSFYEQKASLLAPLLLGKFFLRFHNENLLGGIITEVEAYEQHEPASHSFSGRTPRNAIMFGPAGHLYVYFIYGMHYCANVVSGVPGYGEAVLIRGIEPVYGIEYIKQNRKTENIRNAKLLTGPGNVCKGLGITGEDNGTDLSGDKIFIAESKEIIRFSIRSSERIGITKAKELFWRFTLHKIEANSL